MRVMQKKVEHSLASQKARIVCVCVATATCKQTCYRQKTSTKKAMCGISNTPF